MRNRLMGVAWGLIATSLVATGAAFTAAADETMRPAQSDPARHGMMDRGMMGQGMMGQGMLQMPAVDPARGRKLFASKGCVVCHSVNGIGGPATPFDASTMKPMMNPFEFTARMWRGAEAMIDLQRDELGGQIELTGQELADIIGFVHHHEEQKKFSEKDIPHKIKDIMSGAHGSGAGHGHGKEEKKH